MYRDKSRGMVDPRSYQETESLTGAATSSTQQHVPISTRPGRLWQWQHFGSYVEFIALLIVFECSLFLLLHSFRWYVVALGFFALGLEATVSLHFPTHIKSGIQYITILCSYPSLSFSSITSARCAIPLPLPQCL